MRIPIRRFMPGLTCPRTGRGQWTVLLVLALSVVLLAGCAPKRPPVLEPLRDAEVRTPVVLIPGITGTQLRERETGRAVWGTGRSLFLPRDGGYSIALPLDADAEGDDVEAGEPVKVFRIGFLKFEFYAVLIRLMEANGYRLGDLRSPVAEDNFFIFPYDWRYGNTHTAGELARQLDNLRLVRGEEVLHVHLICQSNAGRIARYFMKYGGASLEDAESGAAGPPERIRVEKLILVGTDNGGSLATVVDLNRGRTYLPLLGRRFRPETIFSFRSLYEGLPAYGEDLFFDERGRPVDADLFDPEDWERYGWSIYGKKVQRRLERKGREDLFGDPDRRAEFLARALDRARRLHGLLARDVDGFGEPRYYMIQNVYVPTPERALLVRKNAEWKTLFSRDKRVKKDPYLFSLASAPGDVHATRESQMLLSPQERAALARPPLYVDVPHREIVLHPGPPSGLN